MRFGPAVRRSAVVIVTMAASGLAGQTAPLLPQRPSPERSLTLLWRSVDFHYTGSDSAAISIDFDHPAFGIRLSGPEWHGFGILTISFGGQPRGADSLHPALHFFDAEFSALTRYRLLGRRRVQLDGMVNGVVAYRRLGYGASAIGHGAQNLTHFGVGPGLLLDARVSRRILVDVRSSGFADMILKQEKGLRLPSIQLSWLWDSDLSVRWERGSRPVGIAAGVGVRVARWRVPAGKIFPPAIEWATYRSTEPALRLGISW